MCNEAGIEGFKTNHSLRATAATHLYSSGVDEQLVMERTVHRSVEGIRSYKRTSIQQQEAVSDILNCKRPCTSLASLNTCGASNFLTPQPTAVVLQPNQTSPKQTMNVDLPRISSTQTAHAVYINYYY